MSFYFSLVPLLLVALELERHRRRGSPHALWFAGFWGSVAVLSWTMHPLALVLSLSLLAAAWTARRQSLALAAKPRRPTPTHSVLRQEGPDDEAPTSPVVDPGPLSDPSLLAALPLRAEKLRRWALERHGVALGDDRDTLIRLDELLLRHGPREDTAGREEWILDFGAALGEWLRGTYGGRWELDPEFGVSVAGLARSPVRAFPIAKVRSRLSDPVNSDDLRRYHEGIKSMLSEHRRQPS